MTVNPKDTYLKGYLRIEIEGFYTERFLNICTKEKIKLWQIKRKNNVVVETSILKRDFKKLKKIAKKTKSKVKIKSKNGIPFIVQKYKNRKVFIFLFFIVILLIFTLSRFIWNIEILGNDKIR